LNSKKKRKEPLPVRKKDPGRSAPSVRPGGLLRKKKNKKIKKRIKKKNKNHRIDRISSQTGDTKDHRIDQISDEPSVQTDDTNG
jgi:hypothetical protein